MACRHQRNRTYGIARLFREQIRAVAELFGKTLSPFPCLSPANRYDRSNAFSFCDSRSHSLAIQLLAIGKAERSGLRAHRDLANMRIYGVPRLRDTGNRAQSYSVTKRAKIGLSSSIVAFGHNFRSVTSAVSNAKGSGQFGSVGIRGITSTIILRAVSEFASKWLRTMSADTGSSSTFQES